MGHLLEIKCVDSRVNVNILASISVQFTPTTVQVPNLTLTHTKRITVWVKYGGRSPKFIWASCHVMCTAVLFGVDPATPPPPHTPAIGTRIRGHYWSAKIDDISL